MRFCVLASALCLLAPSFAPAQWLETTIALPDSFGALTDLQPSVYSRTCDMLYVGVDNGILAIDGATNQRVALIQVGSGARRMCLNPAGTRLYYACDDSILVIDCASNRVTASIWIQRWAVALCFNATGSKLYVGTDQLVIIDVAGDTVLGTRPLSGVRTMCFNPVENKLYCGTPNDLHVFSGTSDSILAVIPIGLDPHVLCLNPVENKLYCTNPGESAPPPLPESIVAVVDCAGDSVLCSLAVTRGPGPMCYNANTNRVYVSCSFWFDRAVCVLDGAGDSLLLRLDGIDGLLCLDSARNILYCGNGDSLAVVDALGDSVVGHILLRISSEASALHHNPQADVIYCVNPYSGGVLVVDCARRAVSDRVPTACWPGAALYVSGPDKVYTADYGPEYGPGWSLVAVDAVTNTPAKTIFVGARPAALCANASGTKVYCVNEASGTVSVIDTWADSLVATVPVGSLPCAVCYNPTDDKVYCPAPAERAEPDSLLTVIDAGADTVIANLAVGRYPFALCHAAGVNKVYVACMGDGSVTVLDGAGDSVLARTPTGGTNPCVVCHASGVDKVYVGHGVSEFVSVIDCSSDCVVATVPTPRGSGGMCYNPVSNKVYHWATGGRLTVIDAVADTVVAGLSLRAGLGRLCCDTVFNKVYLVRYDSVAVIDGATNNLVVTLLIPSGGRGVAWNPTLGRVYVSSYESSCLAVIADSAVGLAGHGCEAAGRMVGPTIVRGTLLLPRDMPDFSSGGSDRVPRPALLDVTGREVMRLAPGENDVSRLSPGVYFCHLTAGPASSESADGVERPALCVRKMIVAR